MQRIKTYASERPGAEPSLEEIPLKLEMGVRCPGCGLIVEAWRAYDLRDAPAAAQAALRASGPKVAGYEETAPFFRCDGCLSRMERDGAALPDGRKFREDILYELQGAPPDFVAEAREVLDLRDARRVEKSKPGVFREEAFRAAHRDLIDRIDARAAARRFVGGR